MNRRTDAYPANSHRVEEDVSNGPSTGPAHRNRLLDPLESRPPSVATCRRFRARNDFHTWRSVAVCSRRSSIRRSDCGRLERYAMRVSKVVGGDGAGDEAIGDSNTGEPFQYGTYRRKEDLMYPFQRRICDFDGSCCRGHCEFTVESDGHWPSKNDRLIAFGLEQSVMSASVLT